MLQNILWNHFFCWLLQHFKVLIVETVSKNFRAAGFVSIVCFPAICSCSVVALQSRIARYWTVECCWDSTHDSAQSYVFVRYRHRNIWTTDPSARRTDAGLWVSKRDETWSQRRETVTPDSPAFSSSTDRRFRCCRFRKKRKAATESDDTSPLPSSEVIFNKSSATPPKATILCPLNNAKLNLRSPQRTKQSWVMPGGEAWKIHTDFCVCSFTTKFSSVDAVVEDAVWRFI